MHTLRPFLSASPQPQVANHGFDLQSDESMDANDGVFIENDRHMP